MSDGKVIISTEVDNSKFDSQIAYIKSQMEDIKDKLNKADMGFNVGDTQKLSAQYEKLNGQLGKLNLKKDELNKKSLGNITQSLGNIGEKSNNVIKKLGKWVLGIFAIESAYGFVRRQMSALTQYDSQIKANLDYINYAMAMALKPIVEWIVNAMFQLLGVVNSISIKLFGINIFANASAEAFKNANNQAKELKKTTAGFDEMNILGNNVTTANTPNYDLSKFADNLNNDKITKFWANIFSFWDTEWQNWFLNVGGNWGSFVEGLGYTLKGLFDIFKGIFELLYGIVLSFVGMFTGNMDVLKKAWDMLCQGFLDIFMGIFELIGGVLLTVIGFIKGIFLDLLQGIYNLVIKPIGDLFSGLWNGLVNGARNSWNSIMNVFRNVGSFFSGIFRTVSDIFRNIGITVGNVVAGAFKGVINSILWVADNILNTPIRAINSLIDVINKVPGINIGRLNTIYLPRLKVGGLVNNPGRGVPVGGALAGESGAEGVIPLTDSQAMETLGNAIGRYITINATVNTNMDGRLINRELQKINNISEFSKNNGVILQ